MRKTPAAEPTCATATSSPVARAVTPSARTIFVTYALHFAWEMAYAKWFATTCESADSLDRVTASRLPCIEVREQDVVHRTARRGAGVQHRVISCCWPRTIPSHRRCSSASCSVACRIIPTTSPKPTGNGRVFSRGGTGCTTRCDWIWNKAKSTSAWRPTSGPRTSRSGRSAALPFRKQHDGWVAHDGTAHESRASTAAERHDRLQDE